jgi:excisionase family DNA binding protein
MGVNLDTAKRTAERAERNAKKLEAVTLYTLTEIEPILGVTHRTLLSYIKDGKLKGAVKIGGKWKISEENLTKFINGEN